ncbi:MAG: endonuclease/exonuclease/phosphatase family protein [Shimia sp.]
MRIATYNVEWFDTLFDDDGVLRADDVPSGRHGVARRDQVAALGRVFQALDADVIMVIEAPDTGRRRDSARALQGFAAKFGLRARHALGGFPNGTQQEITLMFDPDRVAARHDPLEHDGAPRFDGELLIDLDVDAAAEVVRWSKPPLEMALDLRGRKVRMIGVHAKSKAPHGARNAEEARLISIANRRKQLAQCIWLRRRVAAQLAAGEDLIVLGDFNDGPGLDAYEALFGRSGVEIVMGDGDAALYDPHAARALTNRFAVPTTARFWLPHEGRYLQALLDYIMVSSDLRAGASWRILHPFDDPQCYRDAALREALLTASDHFPVVLELPD